MIRELLIESGVTMSGSLPEQWPTLTIPRNSLSEPNLVSKWLLAGTLRAADAIKKIPNNEVRDIAAHLLDIVHSDVLDHQGLDFMPRPYPDFSDDAYWNEWDRREAEFMKSIGEDDDVNICGRVNDAFSGNGTVSSVVLSAIRRDSRPLKTVVSKWMLRWVADESPVLADENIVRLTGLLALNQYRKLTKDRDEYEDLHALYVPRVWLETTDFEAELLFDCVRLCYATMASMCSEYLAEPEWDQSGVFEALVEMHRLDMLWM